MLAKYFPKLGQILLHFINNKKRKYIIKSKYLNFPQWVFCGNKDQKPGGQNISKMAAAHNEYCLK